MKQVPKRLRSSFLSGICCMSICLSSALCNAGDNNKVAAYYRYVHMAYTSLCKENLPGAAVMFDSAFAIMRPFFTDLNNAIYTQVSLPVPDRNKVRQYLEQMQQKGICVHKQYKDIARYQACLKLADSACCKENGNTVLHKRIQEAFALDQVLRRFSMDSLGRDYDARILPALDKIDSGNYKLADSILRTALANNVPVEEFTGYEGFQNLWIILLHNGPWNRYDKGLLDSLVWKGAVDNREISFLFDSYCNGNYARKIRGNWVREQQCDADGQLFGTMLFNDLDDRIYIADIDTQKKNIIDKRRMLYYLPDAIEEAKIKAYVAFRLDEGLRYPGIVSISYEGAAGTFEKNYSGYRYIRYLNKQDYDFNRDFTIGK